MVAFHSRCGGGKQGGCFWHRNAGAGIDLRS